MPIFVYFQYWSLTDHIDTEHEWCHSKKRTFQKKAHSKKGTFQKGHIPETAHSKKGTFQKEHIPKKAHS